MRLHKWCKGCECHNATDQGCETCPWQGMRAISIATLVKTALHRMAEHRRPTNVQGVQEALAILC
eukprot:9066954-Prorocentrum_lima.AAC.1